MTFQFAYNHILNLKEKEKDQAYSEFGLSLRKKELIIAEHHSVAEEREQCLNRWEQETENTISVIKQRTDYLKFLYQKMKLIEERLTQVEKEIVAKKEVFLTKKKDEKMLLILRDKSFASFVRKQKKIEQDTLDEMATIRHYHQKVSL